MEALNEGLMEEMLDSENLRSAWRAVKANRGAAGIDGISVEAFEGHIGPHWKKVRTKVQEGRYNATLRAKGFLTPSDFAAT